MESGDKGDQNGGCLNMYMILKNVESNPCCMAPDILQYRAMPSKTTGHDKTYAAIDAGCGGENISCISKDEDANGHIDAHSGQIERNFFTGSSSSVNSSFPTGYKEHIDVQSSKHSCGGSETFEGDNQFKCSLPCVREAPKSTADVSDKSNPSETSLRDEHAGAISSKAALSLGRTVDLVQNVPNYKHKNPGSMEPADHLFAALDGLEKNEDLENPTSIKEPPKCQMLGHNEEAEELVDVPVCDICGDVGRERLLALCSNCSDGAEHTYCMRIKRDELPGDDWMCEECTRTKHQHKMQVDIEAVNGVKAPPNGTSHDSKELCGDSSLVTLETKLDHTSGPSCLGKRVKTDMLEIFSCKKRVLPGLVGYYAQRVVVSPRNRGTGLRPTRVASSSAGKSSKNVSERMQSPVTGSPSKGRLIKSDGLKVGIDDDGGRKKLFSGKSVAVQLRKEHIPPTNMRKCESFQISKPVYSDASDSNDFLINDLKYQNDIKYQNKGVKCKIAQRSHSFDFKNSCTVSPTSPGKASRMTTNKASPAITKVKQSHVSIKGDLDPESAGEIPRTLEQPALVSPTTKKASSNIVRNANVSGSKDKILNTSPSKDKRANKCVKYSSSHSGVKPGRQTHDMEVEKGVLEEANAQIDGKSKVPPDSSPPACPTYLANSSLRSVWRGIFRIEGGSKLPFLGNKLQGHLSSSASRNIVDMVSKWPCEIMLRELLKTDICPDQLQNCGGATGTDTSIYFFAEDLGSYKQIYKFISCMARNNLVLQSKLDGVELLVFPSHYLPKKARRLNKRFYMCGVFKANDSSCLNNNISVWGPEKVVFQKPEPGEQLAHAGPEKVVFQKPEPGEQLAHAGPEKVVFQKPEPGEQLAHAGPEKVVFQKPEPGEQLAHAGLSGHGNGSVSIIQTDEVDLTNAKCEVKSFIPNEVDAKSADGRTPSLNLLDCSGPKKDIPCQSFNNNDPHVSSGVEDAMHPSADRSSCSNNFELSNCGEYPSVEAGFRYPQGRSPSPLDALLYAVELIEKSGKNQEGSFSLDSHHHCPKVNKWVDEEVQPSQKNSAYHPLNLEHSLWVKENPENSHELDLLSGLANSKDGQNEHGVDMYYDGGRWSYYNVSLDLSLGLP